MIFRFQRKSHSFVHIERNTRMCAAPPGERGRLATTSKTAFPLSAAKISIASLSSDVPFSKLGRMVQYVKQRHLAIEHPSPCFATSEMCPAATAELRSETSGLASFDSDCIV
jgi:hypothetical protein